MMNRYRSTPERVIVLGWPPSDADMAKLADIDRSKGKVIVVFDDAVSARGAPAIVPSSGDSLVWQKCFKGGRHCRIPLIEDEEDEKNN